MELFKNQFVQILFDNSTSLITCDWNKNTKDASCNDFKAWNKALTQNAYEHKPIGLFANTKHYKFTITPKLQEWATQNVFARLAEAGVKKIAIIVSSNWISQLSLEQFTDEYEEGKLINKYFENEEKAVAWLLSD